MNRPKPTRRNAGYAYRETVGAASRGHTVLSHLAARYTHSSEAVWRARLARGEVVLEGRTARGDEPLQPGQSLAWNRPPWTEPDAPLCFALLHLDSDLLAVAKPRGLPTLPGAGFLEHTLLSLVRARYPAAAPAHRLGRGTSGLVLLTRNRSARSALLGTWPRVRKLYRALVSGPPARDDFEIDVPIGRVPHPILGTVHAATRSGKPSLSRVRTLERRGERALVEVELVTGRPHQIRIHLAAAGHPLEGDPFYVAGGRPRAEAAALPGTPGYWLHAHRVELDHPRTGRRLALECTPPPELR
jgi:23S rRNA pseudouridine1911/1915/1917 synthase